MNFALALVHDKTNEVAAVLRADVPLDGMTQFAADHHVVHVGVFADEKCPDGRLWTEWLRESLLVQADGSVHVDFGGPRLLDRACTTEAIVNVSRQGKQVHAHVEAWLRFVLPSEKCDAMGLRRSIPLSVAKSMDRVRISRLHAVGGVDAEAHSRREVLERAVQRRSDSDSQKRHLKRRTGAAQQLAYEIHASIDQWPSPHEAHVADLNNAVKSSSLQTINNAIARVENKVKGKK